MMREKTPAAPRSDRQIIEDILLHDPEIHQRLERIVARSKGRPSGVLSRFFDL
jgi:hypothetical protein